MSYAATKAAYKARRVAEGGCVDCAAGKAEEGHRRCTDCAEKHRAKNRKGPGRSYSARIRGKSPSPVSFARTKAQPGQQFTGEIHAPRDIHGQSPSTVVCRPSQPHMLRATPPPPRPVVILDGRDVEQARPRPARCEIPVRAPGNVVWL